MKKLKKYIFAVEIYVIVCILAVPFVTLKFVKKDETVETVETPPVYTVGGEDIEEYIKGVVAAEMPASFPLEALKAQAVASRTYAIRTLENADKELFAEDIGQAYITKSEMQEKWGDSFEGFYAKISDAVDSTKDEIMVYDGEPILAVFHSTSAGKTETAGNIWNYDLPYLKTTDSEGDKLAPNFESKKKFTEEEIINAIKADYPEFSAEADRLFESIKIVERSEAGYITEIGIGNMTFTGRQIREMLGLRSSKFEAQKTSDGIEFVTQGFGHGAGMSQYGAKYMAENGSDYKDILKHYYDGVKIE